jgi:4-hydroxybenzoate polyprenyltransferase
VQAVWFFLEPVNLGADAWGVTVGSLSLQQHYTGLSRIKLYLALSRTPHGLLDMATPALAALLWLGRFPDPILTILGLLTAFSGYTAVYALNDVVDHKSDKERLAQTDRRDDPGDLDALIVRHPIAQGYLSLRQGIVWVVAWAMAALFGAYALNPLCVVIFLSGCLLEAVYCLMWRASPLRTLVNGMVKTSGGIAAVFAVDPDPSWAFLTALFLWLFFWEIGGQNVPNDLMDLEEDRRLKARTVPVVLGPRRAKDIMLGAIVLTLPMNLVLLWVSRVPFKPLSMAFGVLAWAALLLYPALRLHGAEVSSLASRLFNRASCYPVAMMAVVVIAILSEAIL